jgi:selenocysteine-specific elongation factor
MVCTAGHVDHGKTRLVKLLTGCNTDRLKIEQERGLTIEPGFAPCVLEGDLCVGMVDVPGHEKFIRNMVAGVAGIEMTILVVAADDGIMPQTVEHLRIMEFMGIRRGIVALTKTDLVTPDRREEAIGEVREFLRGTFLDGAPVCPVSSETFEGYLEFHAVLSAEVSRLVKRKRHGVFRMPVEQVFSRKGFGSVIMGIPLEGAIQLGDEVELVPGGRRGRVRGIQQFLNDTDRGEYGQCLALNIPDLGKTPPVRGQVLCLPGYLAPCRSVHVRLHAVSGLEHPLKNAEEVKFHTGTVEESGKLYLLEEKTLASGGTALATVVLNNPVIAAAHDKFIIRRPSPASTIAGGEVLASSESADKPRKRMVLEQAQAYESFLNGADPSGSEGMERRVEYFLLARVEKETTVEEISKGVLLPKATVAEIVSAFAGRGRVLSLGAEAFIHAASFQKLREETAAKLKEAASSGGVLTLTLGDIQKGFERSPRLWKALEEELRREGLIARRGSTIVLENAAGNLSDRERALIDILLSMYEETSFKSPRPDELPDLIGAPEKLVRKLLDYLIGRGRLVRLSEHVILSRSAFLEAQNRVVSVIREMGDLDSADFKYHIDSSRKYALAILDHLDSLRVTLRSGNIRRLAPDYEKRLMAP